MTLPDATLRFLDSAGALGLDLDVHQFPEGTKTSAAAAAAVGCELSAIAKSIVFMVDGGAVVAILSGDRRIDPVKLASAMGAGSARRASLDEAKNATGFAAGGTPAFGYPAPLPVVVDEALTRHQTVWSAAGTSTTVYPILLGDLVRAANAVIAEVSEA